MRNIFCWGNKSKIVGAVLTFGLVFSAAFADSTRGLLLESRDSKMQLRSGSAKFITVGTSLQKSDIWCVNNRPLGSQNGWHWVWSSPDPNNKWVNEAAPVTMLSVNSNLVGSSISAGEDAVWHIGGNNAVYRWQNKNLVGVTGQLKHISVAHDELVVGVGMDDRVWITTDKGANWKSLGELKVKWVEVAEDATEKPVILAIKSDGILTRWNGAESKWIDNPGVTGVAKLCLPTAETIVYLDIDGKAFINTEMDANGFVPQGKWAPFLPAYKFEYLAISSSGVVWALNKGKPADGGFEILSLYPKSTPGEDSFVYYPELGSGLRFSESWKSGTAGVVAVTFEYKGLSDLLVGVSALPKNESAQVLFKIGFNKNTISSINKGTNYLNAFGSAKVTLDTNDGVGNPDGIITGGLGNDGSAPGKYWIIFDYSGDKVGKISWGKGEILGENIMSTFEDRESMQLDYAQFLALGGGVARGEFTKINILGVTPEILAAKKASSEKSIFLPEPSFDKQAKDFKVVTSRQVIVGKQRIFGINKKGKLMALVPGSMGKWEEQVIKDDRGTVVSEPLESLALGSDGALVVVTSKGRVFGYMMIPPVLPPVVKALTTPAPAPVTLSGVPTQPAVITTAPVSVPQAQPSTQTFVIPIPAGATQSEIDALIKQHTGSTAQTVLTPAVTPVAVTQQPVQTQVVSTTTTKAEQPAVTKVAEAKVEPVKEEKPAKGGKKGGKVVTVAEEKPVAKEKPKTPAKEKPAKEKPKTPAKGGGMSAKGKSKK